MPRKKASHPKNKECLESAQEKKKAVKRKKTVPVERQRVPRTRNSLTQTESSFWTMISSALRRCSRYWKPALKVKEKARRPYTGTKKLQKWEYQCAHCLTWHMDGNVQADHITPVGSLKCGDDLKGYVDRLFVEEFGWQILCSSCHDIKTKSDIIKIREDKSEEI